MARSELSKRVAVAVVGIPAVLVAVHVGRWAVGPLLVFLCAGAALEIYRMAEQRGIRPLRLPGAAAAAAIVVIVMLRPTVDAAGPALWTATLLTVLVLALAVMPARGIEGRPLPSLAVSLVGALLPAGAMSYIIFLRHMPVAADPVSETWAGLVGVGLVVYPLAVTWLTDSAAFFAGKRLGRRKLAPSLSPGKTIEGAVAGLVGGTLAGLIMAVAFQTWLGIGLHPALGAAGGLVLAVVSQAGDLAESVWKREAGVKDSGTFFPGHGGLLDRMDSLLFTVPASYWWLAAVLAEGPGW